ncbi:MAG TPA: hypothetical protein VIL79_06660 [Thermoleophilia bacterium]
MRRFITILALVGAVMAALACAAGAAGASAWDVTRLPMGPVVGHVATSGATAF